MADLSPQGLDFQRWFLSGTGGVPGWRNFVGRALIVQIIFSLILSWIVKRPLHDVAPSIVLPVSGVAVALAFAWGAASLPLLTSKAVRNMGKNVPGGIPEYANYFQLAILLVLVTLSGWGVAAAGPYGAKLFGLSLGFAAKAALSY